jgi:hypothetical protein
MTAGKAQTPHQSDDDEQQDIRDEMQSHEPEDSGRAAVIYNTLKMRIMIGLKLAGRKQWLQFRMFTLQKCSPN